MNLATVRLRAEDFLRRGDVLRPVVVFFAATAIAAVQPEPPPVASKSMHLDPLDAAIAAQPVCIGSTVRSAGDLGSVLFYRRATAPDGRLLVGYYAFFSDERPWGNNWLTWTVLPALAIDLVYSRLFFIGPGYRRLRYGPGDVEGFRVTYARGPDSGLVPEEGVADDGHHGAVALSRDDLFRFSPSRMTLLTDTWSHQLGARTAPGTKLAYLRCFRDQTIRPLDAQVARHYRLQHRALPAEVMENPHSTG